MLKTTLAILFVGLSQCEIIWKEQFESDPLTSDKWVVSDHKQDSGEAGKWEYSGGLWGGGDRHGIRTTEDAKFYGISTKIGKIFNNEDKSLVFGLRVKHEQKIDCGGGYAKLLNSKDLSEEGNLKKFNGDSKYSIMFGPDICGYSTKKVQTIFNHNDENLLKDDDITTPDDEFTHSFVLEVNSDSSYNVYVDGESKSSGNLKDDWKFEKPKKIKDPKESKPKDWIDEEMMDDPEDKKPDNWDDEPEKIADPDAEKPDDWDDEEDGEWEAPMIDNPEYKGEWKAKRIKNPDYKGPWEHPEIDNPDYVEQKDVYKRGDIDMVGIEIWQVKSGTVFSDFILADNYQDVKKFYEDNPVNKDDEEEAKKAYDEANKPPEPEKTDDADETEPDTDTDTDTDTPKTGGTPDDEDKSDL